MAYQKINWANGEAGNTPLNANNLNKMDNALDDFESRIGDNEYKVGTLETTVAGHTTAINGKMDKNNPTGTGTLNITNVKCTSVDAVGDTFTLSNKARFSVGSSVYSMASIVNNMVSQSDLNTALLTKVNTTNPTTSGAMAHNGSATISNITTGNLSASGYTSLKNIQPLDGSKIDVYADLNVAGDIYQGGSSTGLGAQVSQNATNIAANTEAINSLSDRCGFEITSASPLNGCSASSIVGIDVDGCSTQDVSANLLNISGVSASQATYSNGLVTLTWDSGFDAFIKMNDSTSINLGSGTYTISLKHKGNAIALKQDGSTKIINMTSDADYKTYSTTITVTSSITLAFVRTDSSGTAYVKDIMINSGSSALPYSPYTGTPTPTNPIQIVDASGDVVAHTVNLFTTTKTSETNNGITATKNNDGSIALSGTATANTTLFVTTMTLKSGTYTFSGAEDGSTSTYYIQIADNPITRELVAVSTPKQYTFTEDTSITFRIRVLSGKTVNATIYPQIEYGTTATSYVAYASNKITLPTLRSVGTVKDELIVNSDGSGQIIKRIGTKDLSTLTWNWNSAFNAYACDTLADISVPSQSVVPSILWTKGSSRTYNEQSSYTSGMITVFASSYASSGKRVLCRTTSAESTSEAPSGTIYYALATPTTTTLTASEVSAIRQLQTYSGTTIIDSALDVKSVTYHAGVKEYIDWRFEQLATLMLGEE